MTLKDVLEEKQMSMYRLAKESKLGFATISEICNQKRKTIDLDTAIKISSVLNVTVEQLHGLIKGVGDNED